MADFEPYTAFADAYFAGSERRFSEYMARYIIQLALDYRRDPIRRVLDVACGMGAACIFFAQQGLDVTGVDQSPEMLINARKHANAVGLPVRFIRQDMRALSIDPPVDLVTCMYDSLNFMLSEQDLLSMFSRTWDSLRQGGMFVFDMYTIRGLANRWGSRTEVHTNLPTHFVVSKTVWDQTTCTDAKTFFGFSFKDGQWHRWQEHHIVRAFSVTAVYKALQNVGFVVHRALDYDAKNRAPVTEDTERFLVIAQRP